MCCCGRLRTYAFKKQQVCGSDQDLASSVWYFHCHSARGYIVIQYTSHTLIQAGLTQEPLQLDDVAWDVEPRLFALLGTICARHALRSFSTGHISRTDPDTLLYLIGCTLCALWEVVRSRLF